VTVSEGRFYDFTLGSFFEGSKEYYDLAQRATAVFEQGNFLGLQAGGSDYGKVNQSFLQRTEGLCTFCGAPSHLGLSIPTGRVLVRGHLC
jgi:hypothetical protein